MQLKSCTNLLLDIGDVLINTKPDAQYIALANHSGIRSDMVKELVEADYKTKLFELGLISKDEFVLYCSRILNIQPTTFEQSWLEVIGEINVELIDQLLEISRNVKLKLFLLSNTNPIHWYHIKELLRDFKYEVAWLSFENNLLKPNTQFFTKFINSIGLDVSSCIFIDDNLKNVDTAAALGIKTIHHIGNTQTTSELKSYCI